MCLIVTAPVVPDSCLPIGATKEDGSTTLLPVQPGGYEPLCTLEKFVTESVKTQHNHKEIKV